MMDRGLFASRGARTKRNWLMVAAVLVILVSCGPVPFNVNVTLFMPPEHLVGLMPFPDGPHDIPPEATSLGAMTWRLPLHDLRVAVDLSSGLPNGPITEATMNIILQTDLDPAGVDVNVDAEAEAAVYLAPESASDLWQNEWRSGGDSLMLAIGEPASLAVPLTQAQLNALGAGGIKLGLEIVAPDVGVSGTAEGVLQLEGFAYAIHEIRITGTAEPTFPTTISGT